MDAFRMCWFYALLKTVKLVSAIEWLVVDEGLTRKQITTTLKSSVNLGCYVTKNNTGTTPHTQTQAPSPVEYVWLKNNNSVPQTENSKIHQNVLVITPKDDTDFGTYTCNVTNGVSSTRCIIELKRGWTKAEHVTIVTGCVNISVLMPVLAVAVLSFLLFIHLLTRRKDNKEEPLPETPQEKHGQRRRSSVAHPHAEQRLQTRRLSRDILYNSYREKGANNNESKQAVVSIEMHVGGDLHSTPKSETDHNVQRERKKGFYKKSFRDASIDLDDGDGDDASHVQGDKEADEGDSPKEIGFYNKNFKNNSMDSTVSDYPRASVDTVFDDSKGKGEHGFYNKNFKNESIEIVDDTEEVFADRSEGIVLDKSKSGARQGFINKFHSDSMDMSDDSASVAGDIAAVFASKPVGAVLDKSKSGNRQGFINKRFHSDSMEVSDDSTSASGDTAAEVAIKPEGAVLDKSKSGNRQGFINQRFHSDSMEVSDDSTSASGDTAAEVAIKSKGAVLDKSKSGNRQGFINKRFHSDSMEMSDDSASAADDTAADVTSRSEGAVTDKPKSVNIPGFFSKTFHTDYMDIPVESDDDARDSGDTSADKAKDENEHASVEDTYF